MSSVIDELEAENEALDYTVGWSRPLTDKERLEAIDDCLQTVLRDYPQ